jgi:hypothetical protein
MISTSISSLFLKLTNNKFSIKIAASIVIAAIVLDTMLATFYDVLAEQLISVWGFVLFVAIIIVTYGIGQHFLLTYLKRVNEGTKAKKGKGYFDIAYNIVIFVQYVLTGIFLFLIIEMLLLSQYHTVLVIAAITISFTPASITIGIIGYRLLSWFKTGAATPAKRNFTVLLLGLSLTLGAVGMAARVISYDYLLLRKPVEISVGTSSQLEMFKNSLTQGDLFSIFVGADAPLIVAYILIWIGTILLLKQTYLKKSGRINYRIIIVVTLPLAALLVGMIPTLLAYAPEDSSSSTILSYYKHNLNFFILLFKLAVIAGGLLFGATYLVMVRSMRIRNDRSIIVDYLSLCSYGIVLFVISIGSSEIYTPYPPFGVASFSFVSLGSYLFGFGIYSAARAVSEDARLRQSIRKSVEEELRLLGSIGGAQMEQEKYKIVTKIAKQHQVSMNEEREDSSISPLTEGKIKQYLEEVLREMKSSEPKDNSVNDISSSWEDDNDLKKKKDRPHVP